MTPTLEVVDGVIVVRDDLYPGGTKARVLPGFLQWLGAAEEVVYASPASGYAQIALAIAAAETGRRAVVFTARRGTPHRRTAEAADRGARIAMVAGGYLRNVEAAARRHAAATGATLLPFGLDHPVLREMLTDLARALPVDPLHVWSVAGSGTLTRALQAAWPRASFGAVQIGKTPDAGEARLVLAPERFEQPARIRPPFPSCDSYDAKAWRFLPHPRPDGLLFWNVA